MKHQVKLFRLDCSQWQQDGNERKINKFLTDNKAFVISTNVVNNGSDTYIYVFYSVNEN